MVTAAHAGRHLLLEMKAERRQREMHPLFPALGQHRASSESDYLSPPASPCAQLHQVWPFQSTCKECGVTFN